MKSNLVKKFESTISVKPDVAAGPSYDVNNHLTWVGSTEVVVQVAWKDVTKVPWDNLTFALSTKVCYSGCCTLARLQRAERGHDVM